MKKRALDVWDDLRDRRLVPVAVALLLALVAVPVVLVKPAEESRSQAATPATPSDPLAKQAVVKAFDAKPLVKISNLDQFASKDPFKPIEQLKAIEVTDTLVSPGGGARNTEPGSPGGGPTGGTPGGGNPGGTPEGGSPGGGDSKPPQKFTYALDLTFIDGDHSKSYKGFDRLGMLPSESSPLLAFLGVDSTGLKAAFIVDASLQATEGEGSCKPGPASCGVVYLEPGQEQSFREIDGHTYTLRIDQIHQEAVGKASATPRNSTATGQAGRPARRFVIPVLIDMQIGGHE